MKFSNDAVELIKEFEGFEPFLYTCPAGKKTIGYGHCIENERVYKNGITEAIATKLLMKDLLVFSTYIKQKVCQPLSQGKYDALCSLVYNWGCRRFGMSKGLAMLNNGQYAQAAIEFFSKEKGVVRINGVFSHGLYRRRQAELALWNR